MHSSERQAPVTMDDIKEKMTDLSITGFHSMSEESPETIMEGLNEVEKIIEGRKQRARGCISPNA